MSTQPFLTTSNTRRGMKGSAGAAEAAELPPLLSSTASTSFLFIATFSFSFSNATASLLSSSSSSFFFFRACWRRNLAAVSSTPSKPRSDCTARTSAPTEVPRTLRSHLCGPGALGNCSGCISGGRVFSLRWALCDSTPASSPDLAAFSPRRPHHGCDEGPRQAPLRRSAARGEATKAAAAASSAKRRSARHQPPCIDSW